MPAKPNRQALILALAAAAGLGLLLLVPSVGRPQRTSAFDSLEQAGAGSAASSVPTTEPAEAGDAQPLVGSAVPGFSAGDMLGLAARLLLVGGILAGGLFLLRVYGQKLRAPAGSTGVVRVLDTLGLASGRMIYVVDAGEKVLLIGATQSQISYLGEITGGETIAALRSGAEASLSRGRSLSDALRGFTSHLTVAPSPATLRPDESAAIRRLMESQAYLRARLQEVQRQYETGLGGE